MRQNPADVEAMLIEAEKTLKRGMQTLTEWGDQARHIMQNRPGVVLASVSIAGFMAGLLLRQGKLNAKNISSKNFATDPMMMFLSGAVAGFTMGPRVMREMERPQESGLESREE